MAWLQTTKRKDGSTTYWIRDSRNGCQIVIETKAGSKAEAQMALEQYEIRRDLEKEGYDDIHAPAEDALFHRIWGPKQNPAEKSNLN